MHLGVYVFLEDYPMTWKWLIPMVIISPLRIGLWDPSKRPNFMAYKWVDPDHLQVLGWSSKLTLIVLLSQSSCWERDFTPFRKNGGPCSGGSVDGFLRLWCVTVAPPFPQPQWCHWYRKYLTAIAHRSPHEFACRKDKTGSPCISTPGQKTVRSQASKCQWRLLVLWKKRW